MLPSVNENLNLRSLMGLPHEEFIPAAFQTILGRMPDIVGLTHYALRLHRGASRALIVAELASSAEAVIPPEEDVDLAQLVRRYRFARNLPLGKRRWRLLPKFKEEPEYRGFDWQYWATQYTQRLQQNLAAASQVERSASSSSVPDDQQRHIAALYDKINTLYSELRDLRSNLYEAEIPMGAVDASYSDSAVSVPGEVRGIYLQLLENYKGHSLDARTH